MLVASTVRKQIIHRNTFMKIVTLALLAQACLFSFVGIRAEEVAKPNIVFVFCDDLGYGDVQCLNPERGRISTPAIDRLAKEGMIFTDAHTSSAVCSPTRYGLLTGRYNWRTRLQSGVVQGYAPCLVSEP